MTGKGAFRDTAFPVQNFLPLVIRLKNFLMSLNFFFIHIGIYLPNGKKRQPLEMQKKKKRFHSNRYSAFLKVPAVYILLHCYTNPKIFV